MDRKKGSFHVAYQIFCLVLWLRFCWFLFGFAVGFFACVLFFTEVRIF